VKATNQVLIVDDVPLNLALLSALVKRVDGLEPVSFTDPRAAIDWLRSHTPALALVDYAMPGLSGVEFLRELRSLDEDGIIPAIVVTGHTDRAALIEAFDAGANDFVRKPIDEIEVVARVRNLAKLGAAARQMSDLTITDELTGIASRRHFLRTLGIEITRARRHALPLSVALFDIDHFKTINDRYGHDAGDAALRQIGHHARNCVRDNDLVGRIGGEEFGWLLPMASADEAVVAVERLRRSIEAGAFAHGRFVTASFGVATFNATDDVSSLLKRADSALYEAKDNGRNRTMAAAA
jgi:diguanylate cyclase (GGDEF)-like protein